MDVIRLAAATLMALAPVPVLGQAQAPPKPLVIEAVNLTAAAARQAGTARGGNAEALRPGDVVRYRLLFTNLGADSVSRVEFTDPVPEGLEYVGGTARADRPDGRIAFSLWAYYNTNNLLYPDFGIYDPATRTWRHAETFDKMPFFVST